MAMKPNSEFAKFNDAMNSILKANPAKVKAEMEEDKRKREEQRKAKKQPSASGHASGDED